MKSYCTFIVLDRNETEFFRAMMKDMFGKKEEDSLAQGLVVQNEPHSNAIRSCSVVNSRSRINHEHSCQCHARQQSGARTWQEEQQRRILHCRPAALDRAEPPRRAAVVTGDGPRRREVVLDRHASEPVVVEGLQRGRPLVLLLGRRHFLLRRLVPLNHP
jgi:hypothetical protein